MGRRRALALAGLVREDVPRRVEARAACTHGDRQSEEHSPRAAADARRQRHGLLRAGPRRDRALHAIWLLHRWTRLAADPDHGGDHPRARAVGKPVGGLRGELTLAIAAWRSCRDERW